MRKLPILLLTATFALSLALPAYAAESSNEELKTASQYLSSHGIMVGDGEGNMNFVAPLTRAHLATILARIHGGSEQVESNRVFYAAQCKFQDVPDWARQYVGYCAYHGLMAGYGGELFGAEDPVTPAAACTVILRYLDLPDLMWDYNSACSVACDLGLITSAMTAKGTVSRGDLAVMLYRTLTGIDQGTSAGADEATVSTMARTKKEIVEQASAAEPETTGTESNPIPQTDPETPPGEVANAGMTDLELAAANTLDPDAPQTDLESGEDTGGQAALPQTDPEWNPDGQSEPGEEGFAPQTDLESADSDTGSHTDLESAETPGNDQVFDAESASGPQTEFETELADDNSAQAAGDAAVEGDAEPPAPSRRRRASRKKATEAQDGGEDAPAGHPEEEQSDSGQPQKLRMPGRRRQRVVSIDAERTVETDTDRLRNDLLDLVESLKGKKILTGTIQGVERLADNPEMSYAVIYHGDFKVIIPVLEAIEEPADYRGQPKGDVLHYLLNKRLGAEVDYIVKGVDQEHNVVAASRLEAMALKRREYYFRTDRDGNYQIYEGIRAEARVISVIRAGIFVDLFGAECYIPLRELSYQRWVDAAQHYQPGQRVLVRVLEVDRSDRSHPRVTASVKQAMENPYEKALKKYVVGNRYVGTVSMVDLNGVFVSLDGGIDCLCTYPKRGRPPRGARATVRILGINHENNRIWGVITHMSTTR